LTEDGVCVSLTASVLKEAAPPVLDARRFSGVIRRKHPWQRRSMRLFFVPTDSASRERLCVYDPLGSLRTAGDARSSADYCHREGRRPPAAGNGRRPFQLRGAFLEENPRRVPRRPRQRPFHCPGPSRRALGLARSRVGREAAPYVSRSRRGGAGGARGRAGYLCPLS